MLTIFMRVFSKDTTSEIWDYLPYGPFSCLADFEEWMVQTVFTQDPQFYVFVPKNLGKASGVAALMRVNPDHGSLEVGHINMAPNLQRTPAGTEGLYLLMRHCMDDLGLSAI